MIITWFLLCCSETSAFDLLQDKHAVTGECDEFKSPMLHCYMFKKGTSLPALFLLSLCYLFFDTCFSRLFCVCVCVCVRSKHASRHICHWLQHDSDASGTGSVSSANCAYFRRSRFADFLQRAASLVNRTRVCRKEAELCCLNLWIENCTF